jgi:hypothetical protein
MIALRDRVIAFQALTVALRTHMIALAGLTNPLREYTVALRKRMDVACDRQIAVPDHDLPHRDRPVVLAERTDLPGHAARASQRSVMCRPGLRMHPSIRSGYRH